jgi:hypothetical protein
MKKLRCIQKVEQEESCKPPYVRIVDGERFEIVHNGTSPLPSSEGCQSSLQRSGLLKYEGGKGHE